MLERILLSSLLVFGLQASDPIVAHSAKKLAVFYRPQTGEITATLRYNYQESLKYDVDQIIKRCTKTRITGEYTYETEYLNWRSMLMDKWYNKLDAGDPEAKLLRSAIDGF